MKTVNVALIGGGYGAFLHANGYAKVHGVPVRIKTLVDIDLEKAKSFGQKFGIQNITSNIEEVLHDPEIDIIDIVTPPASHIDITIRALNAGKHVVCEKPLTGYFGEDGDEKPIGTKVSKAKMYEKVVKHMDEVKKVVEASDKLFMYAENYVYCPSVTKTAEIIRTKKSKLVFMKGEESLRGSSSPVAGQWDKTGGGSLMRTGCHPLSGILWLKQVEAQARNEKIYVVSVNADMGHIGKCLTEYDRRHLTSNPIDVEDFSNVTLTFSDNTKAIVIASDNVLGGTKNYIEIYANDGALMCNITPANNLQTYFLDQEGLGDIYFAEMMPEKTGWNNIFLIDEFLRGYVYELQDFVECVSYGRKPQSDIELAYETTKIMYAAYQSASEGRTIYL
ncbi:putative dehydrogenase [Anaerosolibacter carboniphilus]|uniref:Putative dehydrogenase n=1 Tax=Anaerosolibacter carboniphilus TaxID=1417629 RepID=A0A841KPB3_9FIRM|nr:Gfo/Idh/MocA family oxidoreductase [Anaerosolibacter carboniphilus]MBB6215277.1 putative dehydrogenase [Anaerosolibacter carboniphilus]